MKFNKIWWKTTLIIICKTALMPWSPWIFVSIRSPLNVQLHKNKQTEKDKQIQVPFLIIKIQSSLQMSASSQYVRNTIWRNGIIFIKRRLCTIVTDCDITWPLILEKERFSVRRIGKYYFGNSTKFRCCTHWPIQRLVDAVVPGGHWFKLKNINKSTNKIGNEK